jgi:uncharacterized C2H2 Zn-finger protein
VKNLIKPLLFHPPPDSDDTVASWMDKLAKMNHVRFGTFLSYISNCSKHLGFLQALSVLTLVPIEIISTLHDEFKDRFWNDYKSCPINHCPYKKNSFHEIVHHLMQTHDLGITYFQCPEPGCGYKAKKKGTLKEHVARMHDPTATVYTCEFCDSSVTVHARVLEEHVRRIHDKGKFFSCSICGCFSRTNKDWFKHVRDEHSIWTMIRLNPAREDDGYHCPYCGYVIEERLQLSVHVKNEHGEAGKIKCPYCRHESTSRKQHSKHLRDCHEFGNWYKCLLCGHQDKDKRMFTWHLSNEHDIRIA